MQQIIKKIIFLIIIINSTKRIASSTHILLQNYNINYPYNEF